MPDRDLGGWTAGEILKEIENPNGTVNPHLLAERLADLWEARQLNLQLIDDLRSRVAALEDDYAL